jgi:hypothetical protein
MPSKKKFFIRRIILLLIIIFNLFVIFFTTNFYQQKTLKTQEQTLNVAPPGVITIDGDEYVTSNAYTGNYTYKATIINSPNNVNYFTESGYDTKFTYESIDRTTPPSFVKFASNIVSSALEIKVT